MFRDSSGNVCTTRKLTLGGQSLKVSSKDRHTMFYVPCGQCGECRLSRARMWATRCVHESKFWSKSSFITLTYKDTPPHNSLCPDDTRNFIRRLRRHIGSNFKYYLVGEYGEKGDRPHYHALIFGYDFGYSSNFNIDDSHRAIPYDSLHNTTAVRFPELDDLWELGYTSVGELTFDSAAYCAQYAIKKITGPRAKAHYGLRHPEFSRTSQNAIGKQYVDRYANEILTHNSVISNDAEQPIPSYYLKQLEKLGYDLTELKKQREEFSSDHTLSMSYQRAVYLDSKFKQKTSYTDKLRLQYAKNNIYFVDTVTKKDK